jgi:hypothetical protein
MRGKTIFWLFRGFRAGFSKLVVKERFLQTPPQTPSGLIPVGNTSRLDGCSLHKAIACFGRSIVTLFPAVFIIEFPNS